MSIEEVAYEMGLERDWVNNQASTIFPLPLSFEQRLKTVNLFKNIKLNVLAVEDLVALKIYAYYSRGACKDLEDLKLIGPSLKNIEAGINFLKFQIDYHHGKSELQKHLHDIDQFQKDLTKELLE